MKPKAMECDIGQDSYGRAVTLKYSQMNGKECWEISRAEGDQRDHAERVTGLTTDNLRVIAEAVRLFPGETGAR